MILRLGWTHSAARRIVDPGGVIVSPRSATSAVGRAGRGLQRRFAETGRAGWLLVALIVAGALVRCLVCLALWPVATTLSDSGGYAVHAAGNPLTDPQHPAGYSAFLALLGEITHSVGVTVVLQHGLGVAAAVILFAVARRLVGSPWPALVPAAVVLLNTDEIFLEHNVMSETLFLFVLAGGLYAAVRCADARGRPAFLWAAVTGAVIAAAAIIRSAGLVDIPIFALAIAMLRSPADGARCWRPTATCLAVSAVLLIGYAWANSQANGRFEVAPATGWHLYSRVARFADCRTFTPPAGTSGLCERVPSVDRGWGPDFYLYSPQSPARRLFGRVGSHDAEVGAFALQVILHQPTDFLHAVWDDARRYFVPSLRPHGWYVGWDLDPQLQWSRQGGRAFTEDVQAQLRRFFDPFTPRRRRFLIGVLSSYERVFGFGAALLTLCTLLILPGLFVGSRRSRAAVLLLGIGGLAQLLVPTLSVFYTGRYLVPVAGLVAGAAAISGRRLAVAAARQMRPLPESRADFASR